MWRESKKENSSRKRKVIALLTPTTNNNVPDLIAAQVKRPKSRDLDDWRPPSRSIPHSPRPVCSVKDLRVHSGKIKELREVLSQISQSSSEVFLLLLSGPPGSGKKTTLQLLAAELRISLVSVDVDVELRNLRNASVGAASVTLTDVMKFLTTEGNLVPRNQADSLRAGICLQNLPVGADGTPRQESQKSAMEFLAFTNEVKADSFFIVLVLTEDASHHTRLIWNLREGVQPKSRMREVHFNAVADSQVRSALRLAVAPPNAKKSFKLPPRLEEIIEIIVECCEKDLRQARIKLTHALAELSVAGSEVVLNENSTKDQVMPLFRFLGRCLYGKRVSWALLQAEGVVSEKDLKHLHLLKRIIEALPSPAPCPRLNFGPRPWRLSAALEDEAAFVQEQMNARTKPLQNWKTSIKDDKKWFADLEDEVVVAPTPDPPRVQPVQIPFALAEIALKIAKGTSGLENVVEKATQEGPDCALTKAPIYFDPAQHLRGLGVTCSRSVPGMLARSAPELLSSVEDLAVLFYELSRVDVLQKAAWNETDEEANIDLAAVCCFSAIDSCREGLTPSRGMTEFRRALDKDISEKRRARSEVCARLCDEWNDRSSRSFSRMTFQREILPWVGVDAWERDDDKFRESVCRAREKLFDSLEESMDLLLNVDEIVD